MLSEYVEFCVSMLKVSSDTAVTKGELASRRGVILTMGACFPQMVREETRQLTASGHTTRKMLCQGNRLCRHWKHRMMGVKDTPEGVGKCLCQRSVQGCCQKNLIAESKEAVGGETDSWVTAQLIEVSDPALLRSRSDKELRWISTVKV